MLILSRSTARRAYGVSLSDSGGPDGWRDRAACLDEDPELFFPTGSTGPALLQIEEAKAVCRGCPVLARCQAWAMDNPRLAEFGVFGGLSEEERRSALRRRTRAVRRQAVGAGAVA